MELSMDYDSEQKGRKLVPTRRYQRASDVGSAERGGKRSVLVPARLLFRAVIGVWVHGSSNFSQNYHSSFEGENRSQFSNGRRSSLVSIERKRIFNVLKLDEFKSPRQHDCNNVELAGDI